MFITAKLVFEHYVPEQLEKGMLFKQKIKDVIYGKIYEYDRIYEINHIPQDMDVWVQANGYPVRPRIVSYTANPDQVAETLATYDKIGWWDDGPEVEELRDIELKDYNFILENYQGDIDIEVDELTDEHGEEIVSAAIYADKCTLTFPMESYVIDEDDDDFDEDTPPDDYEDMDWEDDEPEEDSAGYTFSDRYNPDDYETE